MQAEGKVMEGEKRKLKKEKEDGGGEKRRKIN